MNNETGLISNDGTAVSLKSVHVNGTVQGLMLSATTQQRYVNESKKNLEVVYTFPLPAHALILGVSLTIGGKKLTAVVMEKSQAEEDYEEAIREGDLPVMVERSGPGLYTANLGNLKRKEEVLIEVQWAQLLAVRDHEIRMAIPTVIGKRYGDAHAQGGLAPHQTDEVDLIAEYPLTMALAIEGEAANAVIHCASHSAQVSSAETSNGRVQIVSIVADAYLDRDVVIRLSNLKTTHFGLIESIDQGRATVLASFCPSLPQAGSPLALKILVDCSGSMEGDSIEQAKEAVHQVMQQLDENDYVSYSRFGEEVVHNFPGSMQPQEDSRESKQEMLPVTDKKLANIGRLIRSTQANMGGTEMRSALVSTIGDLVLPRSVQREEFVPSLLLITDGDIWDHQGVISAARQSGHRLFAIGVGSAPAESLLRELAESTGGAFEMVSPNESIAAAALRMVQRMRSARAAKLDIDWGTQADWQSLLPSTAFDGETIHVFAQFHQAPQGMPKLTIGIDNQTHSVSITHMDRCEANAETDSMPTAYKYPMMARMAAMQRLLTQTPEESLATALEYELVSEQTNLLLVHVREQEDKTIGLPSLEQIKQMAAAGHSGFGTARLGTDVLACMSRPLTSQGVRFSKAPSVFYDQPIVFRNPVDTRYEHFEKMTEAGIDQFNIPDFLRKQATADSDTAQGPMWLISEFNRLALKNNDSDQALNQFLKAISDKAILQVIAVLEKQIGEKQAALAILLLWIGDFRSVDGCELQRHAMRLLEEKLKTLDQNRVWASFEFLDDKLAMISPDRWHVEQLSAG